MSSTAAMANLALVLASDASRTITDPSTKVDAGGAMASWAGGLR